LSIVTSLLPFVVNNAYQIANKLELLDNIAKGKIGPCKLRDT